MWSLNKRFLNDIYWPKTIRLPDIYPTKMGLLMVSKELWFGMYKEPYARSHKAREGEHFYVHKKKGILFGL